MVKAGFPAGIIAAAILGLGAGDGWATQTIPAEREFYFRVMLNDKKIGYHRFRLAVEAGRETIEINADFDVTFFAIPVYSYDHRNREVWNNGCLEKIDSFTDDDGDEHRVNGELKGGLFRVTTADRQYDIDSDCVMTFAYWNPDFLNQRRLLNAQTGEYVPIEIEFDGRERFRLDQGEVDAERYRLFNAEREIDITLWYETATSQWLSLESRVGDNRVIRYLPSQSRITAGGAQAKTRKQPIDSL